MRDIEDLFDSMAVYGNRIAYSDNGRTVTYAALLDTVKDLYRSFCNTPGAVLIDCDDFLAGVVAMLAALMCHKPYVPVYCRLPQKRKQDIMESVGCSFIYDGHSILPGNDDPKSRIPEETAYVIFTSGSTGTPKGVSISRDNLSGFIEWLVPSLDRETNGYAAVLCTSMLSFDLSLWSILYSLARGARLSRYVPDSFELFGSVCSVMTGEKTELAVMTPTFLKGCLARRDFCDECLPRLKCIVCCGETLERSVAGRLFDRFPDIRLVNSYGPTEACCRVCMVDISLEMCSWKSLPIGEINRASADIKLRDDEILLKGRSVFSGYIGCRDECFTADGWYLTGDRGYCCGDLLFFSGRTDRQIKYKGYRIVLDEIEDTINGIDGVINSAVTARTGTGGQVLGISANVFAKDGIDENLLKEKLTALLPEYMIPSVIRMTDSPAVSASGKTLRKEDSDD